LGTKIETHVGPEKPSEPDEKLWVKLCKMSSEEQQDLRARLEKLRGQVTKYSGTYLAELRNGLARPDLFFEAIPNYLKGYKRVISIGGRDGLVVAHFPIELEITMSQTDTGKILVCFPRILDATEDTFEFITFPGSPVRNLVRFISGREEVEAETFPGKASRGAGVAAVFNAPLQEFDLDTGRLTWQAPWTRLAYADFSHVHFWQDTERAKWEAREDIKPYVHGIQRKELDEVAAPEDIEEAGVKAGDRGAVLEVLEKPSPALMVEYADHAGQTKALITYSKDMETVFDVIVDNDFLADRKQIPDWNETTRERTLDLPASRPVVRGLVPA
jgi:Domain of unknown function (DUF4926)